MRGGSIGRFSQEGVTEGSDLEAVETEVASVVGTPTSEHSVAKI